MESPFQYVDSASESNKILSIDDHIMSLGLNDAVSDLESFRKKITPYGKR